MRKFWVLLMLGLAACAPPPKVANSAPSQLHTPLPNHSWLFYDSKPFKVGGVTKLVTVKVVYRENFRSRPSSPAIPITSNRLNAFHAARRSGQGMDAVLTDITFDVARRTHCPKGIISLAEPTTHYRVAPEDAAGLLGSNANFPAPKGTPIDVEPIKVHGAGGSVRLKCDNPNSAAQAAVPVISAPQLKAMVSGRTHRTYSKQHGTQIEYLAPNGAAYLWYPGNTRAVIGRWAVEPNNRNAKAGVICFAYNNSYNPVTKTKGARHCITAGSFKNTHRESRKGDVFDLSSGRIPYTLSKRDLSFEQL